MINNKEDIIKILRLANEFENNIISIGMGDKGKITRILSPLFGSVVSYASFKNKSSAPGQIDIEELKETINILKKYL